MSRRIQKSMWRDEQRRRSPRLSALDAWKAHQQTPFSSQSSMRVPVMEHQHSGSGSGSGSGDGKGPPSRTRARRIKKKPKNLGTESPNDEVHLTNSDQQLVLNAKETPKHDDHATCIGQQLVASSVPWMPEKRILELILDILQRRDKYEIFAEPVDPNEVEEYYEIIKEPMDFGTMRAKLHEGMYRSLEQFEHDVFLISGNAMHFNSSATIYFRQAHAIQELAKKVFHVLKTDPENFELEFSGARRRSGRRPQGEAKGFNSCPRLAANVRSGGMTIDISSTGVPCSLSGPSYYRRSIRGNPRLPDITSHSDTRDYDFLSGARDVRRSSFAEADRRCTYRPWMSFHNENDSIVSTIYNDPKPLKLVNERDISYRESLMLFVKDLGPTVQKIAKRRRLQGYAPNCQTHSNSNCQIPTAFAYAQRDTIITNTSQKFLPGCHSVLETTNCDIIDLTDADDGEKVYGPRKGEIASNNEGMNVFQNLSTEIHSSSYSSAAASSSQAALNPFMPPVSGFTFDLPFLKSRLNQMNLSDQDTSLQLRSSSDNMRHKRAQPFF